MIDNPHWTGYEFLCLVIAPLAYEVFPGVWNLWTGAWSVWNSFCSFKWWSFGCSVTLCVCVCVSRWGTLCCTPRCSLCKTACWPRRWRPRGQSWRTTLESRSTNSTPALKCEAPPTPPHKGEAPPTPKGKKRQKKAGKEECATKTDKQGHTDRSHSLNPVVCLSYGHQWSSSRWPAPSQLII